MSQPFIGQIQPLGFNFAPQGWAQCNGQILSISQNTALFALLGTFYGGNGTSNFALPNLQSRVPIGMGNTYVLGEQDGEETITLTGNQMPLHTHGFSGTTATANDKPPAAGSAYATSNKGDSYYASDSFTLQPINPGTVGVYDGGSQPHTNIQPYLVVNWCIALTGVFPSRN
jgi:microcystin-dependent protein